MHKEKKIWIPLPADFSFRECCFWLDRGYDDVLHISKGEEILKAVKVGGSVFLLRIRADERGVYGEILQEGGAAGEIGEVQLRSLENYIMEWLDMKRDLRPFYTLLKKDRRMAYMGDAYYGLRLVGIVDLFEALVWSIIGQQINLRFAYTLKRRLVEKYGSRLEYKGTVYHLFPEPADLVGVTVEELRAMQFSRSKAAYIIGLADAFVKETISKEGLMALPDRESRLQALTSLKGIGIWTANYCLMKALRDPSGIPHGDTGLLTALANHGIIKDRKEVEKIGRFFSKYKGWESYLVVYLWRSLYGVPEAAGG